MRILSLVTVAWFTVVNAFALDALHAHLAFKASDGSLYIETQLVIPNNSLHFVKSAKQYQAAYRVQLYYINKTDTFGTYDYTLRSPLVNKPDEATFDLLDIRRTSLPAGSYRIILMVNDLNGSETFGLERSMELYLPNESLTFSSPLLVKDYKPSVEKTFYSRSNYDITPYPIGYFPESMKNLTVYYEVYNAAKSLTDTTLFLQYGLRNIDGNDLVAYQFNVRQHADSVNVFFSSINIEALEAGRYIFYLIAINKKAETVGGTQFTFTRARNIKSSYDDLSDVQISQTFAASLNSDSLMMWLGGLYHLADVDEKAIITNIEKSQDSFQARKFIYRFMQNRQSDAPEEAWNDYRNLFEEVEYSFSSPVRHGYETDRGRVYMHYGVPNHRDVSTSEPGAYPYEVWQYYHIPNGQTNVYFIFYLPGLATNDYKLIHSTARGELQDSRWRYKIYPMSNKNDPDNDKNVRDHFGKRIDDYIPR